MPVAHVRRRPKRSGDRTPGFVNPRVRERVSAVRWTARLRTNRAEGENEPRVANPHVRERIRIAGANKSSKIKGSRSTIF